MSNVDSVCVSQLVQSTRHSVSPTNQLMQYQSANQCLAVCVCPVMRVQAVVQKLFADVSRKDELTSWCETVLHGLETSVDRQFARFQYNNHYKDRHLMFSVDVGYCYSCQKSDFHRRISNFNLLFHPLPTRIVEFSCEILHFLLKLFVHLMRYILHQLRCKGRLSSLCAYLFVDAVI